MHIISSFYSQRLERVETIISGSASGKEIDTNAMIAGIRRHIDSIHPEQDRMIYGKDTLSIRPINLDKIEEQARQQAAARDYVQKAF